MTSYPEFPDAEDVWINHITAQLDEVDTQVSNRVGEGPRFVRIRRTGGPADLFTDNPQLTVDCYDVNTAEAMGLVRRVRSIIHNSRGRRIGPGVACKSINEFSGPAFDPDENHDSVRYSWTFAAKLRPVEHQLEG